MKKNICITGLLNKYSENIAEMLAKELEVFFANVIKFVQFDSIDISNTIEICGIEYYRKIVSKKLKELSKYDSVIIFANYYLLQYQETKEVFERDLLTVYLDVGDRDFENKIKLEDLSELETKIERGAYKVRNKFFSKKCDILVKCNGLNDREVVEKIKNAIVEYFAKGVEKKNGSKRKNSK